MGRKFKPGESGNPEGAAKVRAITDALRLAANEEVSVKDENGKNPRKIKRLRKIAEALFAEAEKGNVRAFEVIAERLEGKVTQPVKHEGESPLAALLGPAFAAERAQPDEPDSPTTH